jgi:ribonuclease P protein component
MTTQGHSFPKSDRLSGRKAIEGLFARGGGGFVYPLRYVFLADDGREGVATLVSVPKKLHKRAVGRNLLKRRMREALRMRSGELKALAAERGTGVRLALLYVTKDVVDFEKIGDAVGKILGQVGGRLDGPRVG